MWEALGVHAAAAHVHGNFYLKYAWYCQGTTAKISLIQFRHTCHTHVRHDTCDTCHTCHECHMHVHGHLSFVDQRAGRLYLLFWNFLPVMKPEKGLMPMARLCLLRHQDIRGNDGLRGSSPCMEKGVKEPHRKAKQNPPAIICYLQWPLLLVGACASEA